ncbi:hypothetical protein [Bacillus cereus]|nr:hypothetical protein [Bacillus cereus]
MNKKKFISIVFYLMVKMERKVFWKMNPKRIEEERIKINSYNV